MYKRFYYDVNNMGIEKRGKDLSRKKVKKHDGIRSTFSKRKHWKRIG